MKKLVKVVRSYVIEYKHEEHMYELLAKIKKEQPNCVGGAGKASDGKSYSYRCEVVGEGAIISISNAGKNVERQ